MSFENIPNTRLRELRLMPVCILCATNKEAHAIAKVFGIENNRWSGDDIEEVPNNHVFYPGEFVLKNGDVLKYYVTSALRQAIQSFAVHAALLFHILRPRYAIHAGSCAGFRDRGVNISDVILGEIAINYEEGKIDVTPEGHLFLIPDYNRVGIEAGDMKTFAEESNTQSLDHSETQPLGRSEEQSTKGTSVHQPKEPSNESSRCDYWYGEYISGSSLRKDATSVLRRVHNNNMRNVIALDMEASAFIQLCGHFDLQHGPMCLGVVKGVSDYGDANRDGPRKEEDWKRAMINTAVAVRGWIRYRLQSITWERNESEEPGAHLAIGYYANFIEKVCNNHMEKMPIMDTHSNQAITEPIHGFKIILPENRDPHLLEDRSVVQRIIDRYDIREVTIGSANKRILDYKAGYFIDWARCINGLVKYSDHSYQVDVFVRQIQKGNFFKATGPIPPFVQVVDWVDAIPWLETAIQAGVPDRPSVPLGDAEEQSSQTSLPIRS